MIRMEDYTVDGWLTDKEATLLYDTARKCKRGAIVEIGSWKGKSTICLGKGSIDGNKVDVYAVDPHTGSQEHKTSTEHIWTFQEFKKNIKKAGVNKVVTPIVKTSEDAAEEWNIPVEFLFIDGAHELEYVEIDFRLWFPYLMEGGVVAIHDTTSCFKSRLWGWPGPRQVAQQYIFRNEECKYVRILDTITYATKCQENNLLDKSRKIIVASRKIVPDLFHLLYWKMIRLPQPTKDAIRKILKLARLETLIE